MNNFDFLSGQKTIIGAAVAVICIVLGNKVTSDQVIQIITNIGQIAGAVLATYGLIVKVYKQYKA